MSALAGDIIDASLDAIITIGHDGNIVEWNRAAERIFGWRKDEVAGKELAQTLVPPEMRERHRAGLKACVAGADSRILGKRVELTAVRADGTRLPVDLTVVRVDGGGPPMFTAFICDITLRKRAEQALRESEEKFRALAENLPEIVWMAKTGGETIYLNSAFVTYTGIPMKAGLSRGWTDVVHPADMMATREAWARSLASGSPYECQLRVRRKDGNYAWMLARGNPIRDESGEIAYWIGTCTDINELKEAHEKLRLSEERFRLLGDAANDVIYDWNLMTDEIWWNDRFSEQYGYSPEERSPTIASWTDCIAPEDKERVLGEVYAAIDGRAQGWKGEYGFRRRDGSYAWVFDRAFIIRDAGGKAVRMVGGMTDITEQRRAKEEILRLNSELAERANGSTAQLEAANRELEAFSYSISHDLRAPLRTIDGFSKIVLEEYGPALPEEGRDYLHAVRRGAQSMAKLIDDLLAFSRLSRQALHRQDLDTAEIVRAALDAVWPQYPGRQEDVHMGPLPRSNADPALLRQVWVNLLSNAYKFTGRTANPRIEVGAIEGETPTFFVRDNGVGYDPRYATKLFTVFQRLHGVTEFPGTGVGLAIVQRIVHRHHGRIWAEGVPDAGATFYFTLG